MCQPGRPRPHGESHDRVLVRFRRLPQREVARILLARVRLLLFDLVEALTAESAVLRVARDSEVHVPVGLVGEASLHELLDHRDLVGDGLDRRRLDVGAAETEPIGVLDVPARGIGGELRACARRGVVDLVVDVRDVDDELRLVARLLEPAREPQREHRDRKRVANVDALVDRRSAEVHANRARGRWQLAKPPTERVVQAHGQSIVVRSRARGQRARELRRARARPARRRAPARGRLR